MFPSDVDQPRPARRSFRAVIANAADLTVAFLTLESYGLDDLRRATPAPHEPLGAEPPTVEGSTLPQRRSADSPMGATSSPSEPLAAPRAPHRRELRPTPRHRRPGRSVAREQFCLTPLDSSSTPARTAARRRAAVQDAPR